MNILIFDWGNTLMQVLPSQAGPMYLWSEVLAVSGAGQTLAELSKDHSIFIATNAGDSDAAQVRMALGRVQLDRYIDKIFTNNEVGWNKNKPEFYLRLSESLHREPIELIMIGDDFEQDVKIAHMARLKTVWFNPQGKNNLNELPVQTGEIHQLSEIRSLLTQGFLPELDACDSLLTECKVPDNVRRHTAAVAVLAYHLADKLKAKNINVDPILVHRAAYLHDIDKMITDKPAAHGHLSAGILREWGQPEIARLVEAHALERILDSPEILMDWGAKLVYYADKRYDGENYLSVEDRCQLLMDRHPCAAEKIRLALPKIKQVEAEIEKIAGKLPDNN